MISLNPKAAFAASVHAKAWDNVAASEMFVLALNAATLEMQSSLNTPKDANEAAANYYRMQGAREFALFLINLTTPKPPQVERADIGNLDHTV
jgi:hypothetical protein